jgi:hypothetical protein
VPAVATILSTMAAIVAPSWIAFIGVPMSAVLDPGTFGVIRVALKRALARRAE